MSVGATFPNGYGKDVRCGVEKAVLSMLIRILETSLLLMFSTNFP